MVAVLAEIPDLPRWLPWAGLNATGESGPGISRAFAHDNRRAARIVKWIVKAAVIGKAKADPNAGAAIKPAMMKPTMAKPPAAKPSVAKPAEALVAKIVPELPAAMVAETLAAAAKVLAAAMEAFAVMPPAMTAAVMATAVTRESGRAHHQGQGRHAGRNPGKSHLGILFGDTVIHRI